MTDTPAAPPPPTPAAPPSPAGRNVVAQTKESVAEVRHDAVSVQGTATELSAMVIAYARQETLDPIKQLGRYVLYGVIGAVLIGVGGFLMAMALIRSFQTELSPHLSGDWSWVPYLAAVVLMAAAAALAVTRIGKGLKSTSSGKDRRP